MLRYLTNGSFNLHEHAHRLGITEAALHARIRKSLDCFLAHTPWGALPTRGNLIVVVDALIERIQECYYTVYFVVLRPAADSEAIILAPIVYPRYENKVDWQRVFQRIPDVCRMHIVALVGDGSSYFLTIARAYGWHLQRCHFHLFAELHRWASLKRRSRYRQLARTLHRLVRRIVTTTDARILARSLAALKEHIQDPSVPDRIKRRFLTGFFRHYQLYRTYLYHPALNLPTTTNSCETLCRLTRAFLGRAHGIRTASAYAQWVKAVMLSRKKVSCKGADFQPN